MRTFVALVGVCTCQLQWLHVAATDLRRTLNFDAAVAYYSMAFGISSERLLAARNTTTSSGIMWTECVYVTHTGECVCVCLLTSTVEIVLPIIIVVLIIIVHLLGRLTGMSEGLKLY